MASKWTAAELQSKQEADPNLRQILLWKRIWVQWNWLLLEKGVLYHQWQTKDGCGTRLQLVLPCSLVQDILSAPHDAPSAGHLGVTETIERVQERFYWYGLQHDVEDWCRQCEKCARRKSRQATVRAPLVSSCPGYLFERIALCIIGPLPTTKYGNKYILVVRDYFTKWKKAFAIPTRKQRP